MSSLLSSEKLSSTKSTVRFERIDGLTRSLVVVAYFTCGAHTIILGLALP